MGYAFMHIVFVWIFAKAYEKIKKYSFSHIEWALIIFIALLPDIDLLYDWTFGTSVHRMFLSSLVFFALALIASFILVRIWKKLPENLPIITLIGISSHFILDMVSPIGIQLLWPLPYWISFTGIKGLSVIPYDYPLFFKFMVVDMAIGTAWLLFLILKNKFKL